MNEDSEMRQAVVDTLMNIFWFRTVLVNSLLVEERLASKEGQCSVELCR
jgi:hypothetical protein